MQEGNKSAINIEDVVAERMAFEQLKNIEENSFEMRNSLRQIVSILEQMKDTNARFISIMYNYTKGIS
jgi:hypothetical protein